jgi:IS30 family transposase
MLRERTTQYGIIINLPYDHTANSVNTAVAGAFTAMPAHMKRTLTWDQGVEMARHQELTAATGVPIFFAERSSPWQRGERELQRARPSVFPTCMRGSDVVVGSAARSVSRGCRAG